jgi:hypothetical protein
MVSPLSATFVVWRDEPLRLGPSSTVVFENDDVAIE